MVGGFVPTAFGAAAAYTPNLAEWTVVAGIWAFGELAITMFYKIVLAIRQEAES